VDTYEGFSDALIDDKKTGQRFRADKIIEAYFEKVRDNLNDEDLAKKLDYQIFLQKHEETNECISLS
jgi:glycyl-tRNA synthetase (class II)